MLFRRIAFTSFMIYFHNMVSAQHSCFSTNELASLFFIDPVLRFFGECYYEYQQIEELSKHSVACTKLLLLADFIVKMFNFDFGHAMQADFLCGTVR